MKKEFKHKDHSCKIVVQDNYRSEVRKVSNRITHDEDDKRIRIHAVFGYIDGKECYKQEFEDWSQAVQNANAAETATKSQVDDLIKSKKTPTVEDNLRKLGYT